MIQIGQWSGHYTFNDEKVNKIRGFENTFFEIDGTHEPAQPSYYEPQQTNF